MSLECGGADYGSGGGRTGRGVVMGDEDEVVIHVAAEDEDEVVVVVVVVE